ncbi:uncharacterized protein LOC115743462 [Rhodamnia argentea]|uniref:Uncharacterized protein LOC115743462 n=1 Tax=Rhodamnia argentea TaxID=178133 RepID=A0ABM3HGW1_9MYRT|nr:uncharacterized protein LOC115743462 [Rhodamnia argentea]
MYGQGFYGPQTGQGPYPQHHLPTALPPPNSSQSLAAWNSVMRQPPASVPFQINQQIPRGSPFQGSPAGMTNTTNPSHASLPPQPPPVLGRMPITGPYRNSQHNLHYPLHVGTQNSHHFPTPSPPPPPPLVQGQPTYWHPVNSQPRQPISVQIPPIPNTPPPLPPPPPSQPPLPYASSSPVPPSPPFCRPLLPTSSVSNISSSTLALDVSGQRNDKVVTSEGRAVESLSKQYGSISALGRSTALEIDVHPAPPKPADKNIMKRIETLYQFIAKNGPGFEDMTRTRESANPEFKFLFGGEPGSDAAVAHEYYQWTKKKYTFGDKLQEGALNLRPSEAGISVQTKPFTMTSAVHPSSDSDMEMEDDITQVDMDQEMERPVEYYRQDSDLVRYDQDGKEPPMPQTVQCASAQDVLCYKVPFSEVPGRSDYGHQGSGILPYHEWLLPGSSSNRICSDSNLAEPAGAGIAKKLVTVLADVSRPPISSPAVKSGRPFRLVQDDASNDSLENCAVPHSKGKHTTAELSVAPGYINKSDYTECRSESYLQVANLGKIEQVVGPLSESGKSFVAPTSVSNVKTRVVETVATLSEIGLSDEPSDTNYNDQGTIHNAACLEAFARNNSLRSLSTGSHENGTSEKETGGEKLRPNSTPVQVDEFGRLVRKGTSDWDLDDSLYAGRRHKKRERSQSWSQSPVGRRNRRRRSLPWAIDRRNRSRLENSTAQRCNASNPLREKKYSKRKKKQSQKRLKRKQARKNGAELPYAVLQKIKEERKKKRIMRRAQKREATAREKVSGKSNLLGDVPNNVLQVADLDESVMREFSSTCDCKPEQVEERLQDTSAQASMGTSKEEASVPDPEQRLDLPERPETIKLHSAEDGSAEVVLVESTAVTEATENKNAEKLIQVQTVEEHVSCVDKEVEAASNCNAEASVESGRVSCCEHSNGNGFKVNRQIDEVNPSSELLVSEGDIKLDININEGSMPLQIPGISSERTSVEPSRKKLLILDLNGLLADIIPYDGYGCKPDLIVSRKAVFKRPFVDDFLQFCFEKFAVGVWSSRTERNVVPVVDFLMGDSKERLLFCWDQSHCTATKFTTIENRDKPLVLKELRKLWDKLEPNLPWEKGVYNDSNTLLLDDSPYKALRNPPNTGIFPYSYHYRDAQDDSLGPGGELRVYLESLALADDVRKYVEQNPFGQRAITKSNPSWNYYKRVLAADAPEDATSVSNLVFDNLNIFFVRGCLRIKSM